MSYEMLRFFDRSLNWRQELRPRFQHLHYRHRHRHRHRLRTNRLPPLHTRRQRQ